MMEIRISLNEYADIPFIKKLLSQIKGISDIELIKDDQSFSWDELENSEEFKKLVQESREQIKNGEYVEYSKDFIDSIFKKC